MINIKNPGIKADNISESNLKKYILLSAYIILH